jgi:signal transduction histidine kinase
MTFNAASRFKRHAPWVLAWCVASLVGALLIARMELSRLRDAFETDARIAHRLLSQKAAQHDAVLSTLALLRPTDDAARPEQRLPSVYPQILSVQRRDRVASWADEGLRAAEAESRRQKRPALADVNFAKGRYQLVLGAEPTSYALLIDLRAMIPWNEWPMVLDASPVRVTLEHLGQRLVLQPGNAVRERTRGWHFEFHRALSADSQPFELVAERQVGWVQLPWAWMLSWSLLVAVLLLAARALLRQRHDRHRAEELLRLGQIGRLNTLGELAAGLAHELNQPLTAILASTQAAGRLLADDLPNEDDLDTARVAITQAIDQAKRASDVVNRLRRAVEQPELTGQVEPVNLLAAARNALDLLEPELARLGISPHIALDGPEFTVLAEPVALEQVIHNLMVNALQALELVPASERSLTAQLNVADKRGRLTLQDTGPGIPNNVVSHIFEPFFTTRRGALGLGLSLCETLTSGMGGTLMAYNRVPRGAEFCLSLPLAR